MTFYPNKISRRFRSPKNAGHLINANAEGKAASFVCGVLIRFFLEIENESKEIINAKFKTNGCGYVIATADHIAETIIGQKLTELHGLEGLEDAHKAEFEEFSGDREHCANICFDALSDALARYRNSQIEEWTGEKALICSCFVVAEEAIEKLIKSDNLKTVDEVSEKCNAGLGCGSCQPLIQEILDSEEFG